MKKFIVFTLMLGALAALVVPAFAARPPLSPVYGNDEIYQMIVPKFPIDTAHQAYRPLYVVGEIPAASSFAGDFTDVVPIPPKNKGTYTAIWEVHLVLPGPNAIPGVNVTIVPSTTLGGAPLVRAADLGGGLTDLTSEAKILAAEALGLVFILDAEVVFVCPIVKVGQPQAPPAQKRRSKVTTTWARLKAKR